MTKKILPRETSWLSPKDQEKIMDTYHRLSTIDGNETSFIRVELLFFEMIALIRKNPANAQSDLVLYKLKKLQEQEYKRLQNMQLSVSYRTTAIRSFKNCFRAILRFAMRNF